MLTRFSLYGFFKNQRYFEPFLILYFLENGLTYSQIGILVAFRELFRNIFEVPSGSFADLRGRRFSIILSFATYIISFIVFGFGFSFWHFFIAIFFFAIGDAFRTGTHKAMIFAWLRKENRESEKTKVYGFTRSWSKIGSAVSIVIATLIVLFKNNYDDLFLYAAIPYVLGLANIISYPRYLDGEKSKKLSAGELWHHFYQSVRKVLTLQPLRRLMSETMFYEGSFGAIKDYLQPILFTLAVSLPYLTEMDDKSRSSIIIGIVYFILYLASALASRKSHYIADKLGNEEKGTKFIWLVTLLSYCVMAPFLYIEMLFPTIFFFIVLNLLQNLWRPMQISRFGKYASEEEGAAILSIESQSKSFATMILAPVIGIIVDLTINYNIGGEFWSIAILGSTISAYFYFRK